MLLEFIKYLPLDWRKRDEYCVPKWPHFRASKKHILAVGGSKLRFRSLYGKLSRLDERAVGLSGADVLDEEPCEYHETIMPKWHNQVFTFPAWLYWGPWMSGLKAVTVMYVSVIRRREEYALPVASLFQADSFEVTVGQYYDEAYGRAMTDESPMWRGLMGWTVLGRLPVYSAAFKLVQLDGIRPLTSHFVYVFPITDHHFVEFSFRPTIESADEQGAALFDTSLLSELPAVIINSISLELSQEAEAAWDEAQAESGRQSLTSALPERDWPTAEDLDELREYLEGQQKIDVM